MIRREMRLDDGAAGWMLISQIEHARLSAQLASHAIAQFGARTERAGSSPTPAPVATPASVRQEVLDAILHHDDGWAAWERAPRLDPERRRPLSFTELAPAEALAIWSASIEAAAKIGPLAASMVAGHFMRLLDQGDSLHADPAAVAWRADMAGRRDAWLAQWRKLDSAAHTPGLAAEALQWLWTFDEISLWFCTTCPAAGATDVAAPPSYRAGRGTPVEMQLLAAPARAGRAAAAPWRFDVGKIAIAAVGQAAPAKTYAATPALLADCRPYEIKWLFTRN
jgi:hypothetical protein